MFQSIGQLNGWCLHHHLSEIMRFVFQNFYFFLVIHIEIQTFISTVSSLTILLESR